MVVVVADHGAHHAQLVGHAAQARQQIGEIHAAAAILAEGEGAGHEPVRAAAGLKALDLAGVLLAVPLLQLRLGVEKIDLAWAARLHEQDDRTGLGRKVARPRTQVRDVWGCGGVFGGQEPFGPQQVRHRHGPQAQARLLQEGPARNQPRQIAHDPPHST